MKNCKDCGTNLVLIETGEHTLWTCLQCAVEFNDIQKLTKDCKDKFDAK